MISKRNAVIIICSLLLVMPNFLSGMQNNWEKFLKLKEKFYFLDRQNFEEITFFIDTPFLNKVAEDVEKNISDLNGKATLEYDLRLFSLTFSKNCGIRFNNPHFELLLLSDEEELKESVIYLEKMFNQQVDRIKNLVSTAIEDLCSPQKDKYKNLTYKTIDDTVIVNFMKEEGEVKTEKYYKNIVEGVELIQVSEFKSIEIYKLTKNNKLILEKGSASNPVQGGELILSATFEYQFIDGITLPKTITSLFEYNVQGESKKGELIINFYDCKIK